MVTRLLFLFTFAVLMIGMACAQFEGVKITLYAKGVESKTQSNKFTLSEPFKGEAVYEEKGGQFNVWFKITWTTPLAANTRARVLVLDAKDIYADDINPRYFPKGMKELTYKFRLTKGSYKLQLVDADNQDKVYASTPFKVVDKVGVRASGNQKAGQAQLWVCEKIDDSWNPVGADGDVAKGTFKWPANKQFNVLIKNNHKPFGTSFLGIVIHKQGADGKDESFITEFQSESLDEKKATMWGTTEGLPDRTGLEPGVYTIYLISWSRREATEHLGNLKEYFAKLTLTVG